MRDERLGSLDGIAIFLTGVLAAALLAFPLVVAPAFRNMFADFGSGPLPLLTRWSLSGWFPGALGALVLSGPVLGCIPAVPLRYRRRVLVATFVVGCASVALCVTGVYLPVFELAGKIKA